MMFFIAMSTRSGANWEGEGSKSNSNKIVLILAVIESCISSLQHEDAILILV